MSKIACTFLKKPASLPLFQRCSSGGGLSDGRNGVAVFIGLQNRHAILIRRCGRQRCRSLLFHRRLVPIGALVIPDHGKIPDFIRRKLIQHRFRQGDLIPYLAFLISVFSALRLAKFNNDTRQTSSFVGLPVPANALFWGSLVAGAHDLLVSETCHPVYLFILVCLFSWLLVSEIPMFSLKFKNLSWKDNKISFIFLIICIPLLIFLGISSFAAIIVWYILLSLFTRKMK